MEQHVQPSPGVTERVKRNQRKSARCHRDPKKCAGIQKMSEQAVRLNHKEAISPPSSVFFVFPVCVTLPVVL